MTVFKELMRVTEDARNGQDLPDYLAERILQIIENSERYRGAEAEIAEFIEKVRDYDTYGQTGYLGMGVNSVILEKALRRLEERRAP